MPESLPLLYIIKVAIGYSASEHYVRVESVG
jgi:hypothetical protein